MRRLAARGHLRWLRWLQGGAGVLVLAGGLLAAGPAAADGRAGAPPGPVPAGTTCATAVTAAPTGPATVAAVRGPDGPMLVVGSGPNSRCSLYVLTSDQPAAGTFGCSGFCAQHIWPALLTDGAPVAGPGVNPKLLGTITRTDVLGTTAVQQVTYAGMPLYQFLLDKTPGETNGEDLFDGRTTPPGVWYVVDPARGLPAPGTATLTLEGVVKANSSTVPPVVLGALVNTGAGDAIVPVYSFTGDSHHRSACTGECAVIWPPLLTQGRAQGTTGVDGRAFGTIVRPDGSHQVTYRGRPLYLFRLDAPASPTGAPGTVNGQGLGGKFCPTGMSSCTGFYTVTP